MKPTQGKQEWRCCSSQPNPREAKLLAPELLILLAKPQEKNLNASPLAFHRCLIIVQ